MVEHKAPTHDPSAPAPAPEPKSPFPEALTKGGPITVEGILDAALAGTDLPARGDKPLTEWVKPFEDPELVRRVTNLLTAAASGNVAETQHWAHQAEDAFLRKQLGGKNPAHT